MTERADAYEFVSQFVRDLKAGCDIGAESLYGGPTYEAGCKEEISQWEEVLCLLDPRPFSDNDEHYTMAEAAQFKGVSYHTVSRAVRRGVLPANRLGRQALISRTDLEAWRPMVERAPRKYRRREPNADVVPVITGEVRA